MTLEKMYPPQKDSPSTYLVGDIGTEDVYIFVGSTDVLPQAVPFPMTIGFDKSVTETVIVTDLGDGNGQLTVTRGPSPLTWVAGTKCGRVFTADDLDAVQKNIAKMAPIIDNNTLSIAQAFNEIEANAASIEENTLNIEANTYNIAENAEAITTKVGRSELTVLITDVQYAADGTAVKVTFATYDAQAKKVGSFDRYLPIVSTNAVGIMTPEAYNSLVQLQSDVAALQQQGGHFIGVSFATAYDLSQYEVPSSVHSGDFTYVLDDETHSDATTKYIYDGSSFEFAIVVNFDPVGIATASTPGIVKSDGGATGGKIFVEADGTMSGVGWTDVTWSIANEIATARAAENALSGAISGEATRATNAESSLMTRLTSGNVCIGLNAQVSQYDSARAIAIGYSASATDAYQITIGASASVSGQSTTVVGRAASASGSQSSAFGTQAKALARNAVSLGSNANASGEYSIAIGEQAKADSSYSIAFGPYSSVASSEKNTVQLGGSGYVSVLRCTVALTVTSDERDKTDIAPIESALGFLSALEPIQYADNQREKYIPSEEDLSEHDKELRSKYGMCNYDKQAHARGDKKGERKRVGISAQQIVEALNATYGTSDYANLVNDNLHDVALEEGGLPEGVESKLTVAYSNFVPFLVKGIQELSEKNAALEARISALEAALA